MDEFHSAGGNDQPLGKLTKAQIEKGDAVLDRVQALLRAKDDPEAQVTGEAPSSSDTQSDANLRLAQAGAKAQFAALSAEFYTMIPHNFGIKKPPVINNQEILGAEKALLQFYLRMGFEEIGGDEDEKLAPIAGVMDVALPKTLTEAARIRPIRKPATIPLIRADP